MLLEDNGLLPFLEDWHFFAEPKIQSNTVVAFFPPILLFSSFTIYTLIFNPYIPYIGSCTVHLNIRLDMAILSTKLEKGLSSVRAMNFVISRCCKTLLNWTNKKKKKKKNTGQDSLGFWSLRRGIRIPVLKFHGPGIRISQKKIPEFQIWQAKVFRILKFGLPLGDQ